MTSLSFPNPEIGIETLVFGLMINFYAMMILDRGGAERAGKGASGEGGCEGSRAGLGAGRPVVGDFPGVLSTKCEYAYAVRG
jgi:hypothetical protein